MSFRFRKTARLGPLRFNFARSGLSWSVEAPAGAAAGPPNSRRLRPVQLEAFKGSVLAVLQSEVFGPGTPGQQLWDEGTVSRLLAIGSLGARLAGLLALIETPEAMADYITRSRSQDDAKRRAHRCIEAMQEATRLAAGRRLIGS